MNSTEQDILTFFNFKNWKSVKFFLLKKKRNNEVIRRAF